MWLLIEDLLTARRKEEGKGHCEAGSQWVRQLQRLGGSKPASYDILWYQEGRSRPCSDQLGCKALRPWRRVANNLHATPSHFLVVSSFSKYLLFFLITVFRKIISKAHSSIFSERPSCGQIPHSSPPSQHQCQDWYIPRIIVMKFTNF